MDLAIRGGNVATLTGAAGARPAGACDVPVERGWTVAIKDGRIAWVGPDDEFDGVAARTIDATGRLVTPGYVDSHTHLVYAGDRAFEIPMKLSGKNYLDILAAGGGIAHTTGLTRAASQAELVKQAGERLRRMQRNGSTTVEAKSGYALELEGELRMLAAARELEATGVRMVHTFLGAHAVPDGMTADEQADAVVAMIPHVADQGIATFCDAFVEEGVFTAEHAEAIFAEARKHGLKPRLHADEIVNTGGAELAAQAGSLSADHLLRVSPEGIAAMAEAGTIATLLPTVPMTLMRPEWAPGRDLLAAGVPIALATDHNPNNPVTDMGLVAQMGCFLLGLSPAQSLTAATWNGAQALGLDDVGHLGVGARGDVLVHNVGDLDHWVYEIGRRTVDTVVCNGKVVA